MRKWILLGLMFATAGCKTTLETGYEPRRLGASDTERRAFYASPFSPESRAAAAENNTNISSHRPGRY